MYPVFVSLWYSLNAFCSMPITKSTKQMPYIIVSTRSIPALGAPSAVRELMSVVMGLYSFHSIVPKIVCAK
ncbi:hypothetical protein D3C81_2174460 [compost metagenome]